MYILFLFGPVDGEVLHAEALVEVWHGLGNGIDDMGDFVRDDKFDILGELTATLAAS